MSSRNRKQRMTPGEAGEALSVEVMEGLGNAREGFGLAKGLGDWEPPEGFEQGLTKPISQEARLLASPATLPHL